METAEAIQEEEILLEEEGDDRGSEPLHSRLTMPSILGGFFQRLIFTALLGITSSGCLTMAIAPGRGKKTIERVEEIDEVSSPHVTSRQITQVEIKNGSLKVSVQEEVENVESANQTIITRKYRVSEKNGLLLTLDWLGTGLLFAAGGALAYGAVTMSDEEKMEACEDQDPSSDGEKTSVDCHLGSLAIGTILMATAFAGLNYSATEEFYTEEMIDEKTTYGKPRLRFLSREKKPLANASVKLVVGNRSIELGKTDAQGHLRLRFSDVISCGNLPSDNQGKTFQIVVGDYKAEISAEELITMLMSDEEKDLYLKHLVSLADNDAISPNREYSEKYPKGCMRAQIVRDYFQRAIKLVKGKHHSEITEKEYKKIRALALWIGDGVSHHDPRFLSSVCLYTLSLYFAPDRNPEEMKSARQMLEANILEVEQQNAIRRQFIMGGNQVEFAEINTSEARALLRQMETLETNLNDILNGLATWEGSATQNQDIWTMMESQIWESWKSLYQVGGNPLDKFARAFMTTFAFGIPSGLKRRIDQEGGGAVLGDLLRSVKRGSEEAGIKKRFAEYEQQFKEAELEAQRSKCEQKCKDNYKTCTSSDTYPVPIPLPNTPAAVCEETKTQCLQSCQ